MSHISEPGGAHYLDSTQYAGAGRLTYYRHRAVSTILSVTPALDRFARNTKMQWGVGKSMTEYTYDLAGNRLSRDVANTTTYDQSYEYDGLQRLVKTDQGQWNGTAIVSKNFEQDQTLDQLGNWENLTETDGTTTTLDQTRYHNSANEIDTDNIHGDIDNSITTTTGTNWYDPKYDAAGNMTEMPRPGSLNVQFGAGYDAWNRLVIIADVGPGYTQVNQYDGLHRRISSGPQFGNKVHYYYNEKWQCLEERVEASGVINPNPIKQYVYFPFYVDAVASVLYDPDADGVGITRYDYLHDANFNVVVLVTGTTSFDVVERYSYSPYGEVTFLNPDYSVKATQWSAYGNEFLYTGRRLDYTGLYYYRYRFYHPQMGRWINRDPIGYAAGDMNLYGYVGGMPTRYVDPLGLEQWSHPQDTVFIYFNVTYAIYEPWPTLSQANVDSGHADSIEAADQQQRDHQWDTSEELFHRQIRHLRDAISECCCRYQLGCKVVIGGASEEEMKEYKIIWNPPKAKPRNYDRDWSYEALREAEVRVGNYYRAHGYGTIQIPLVVGGPIAAEDAGGMHNDGRIQIVSNTPFVLAHEFGHYLKYKGDIGNHSSQPNNIMIDGELGSLTPQSKPDRQWCQRLENLAQSHRGNRAAHAKQGGGR